MALHDVGMEDLLLVCSSGIWVRYNDVNSGTEALVHLCYQSPIVYGFNSIRNDIRYRNFLNETDPYFSVYDGDGNNGHGHGPTWNASTNDSVYFDDPGTNALGPGYPNNNTYSGCEWNRYFYDPNYSASTGIYVYGVGFGNGMVLNSGGYGTAENYMQVFVRRDYTDADGDGVAAWEDCDDGDASVTACQADSYTYSYVVNPHTSFGDDGYDGSSGQLNDGDLGGTACNNNLPNWWYPHQGWQNQNPEFDIVANGLINTVSINLLEMFRVVVLRVQMKSGLIIVVPLIAHSVSGIAAFYGNSDHP